MANWQSLCVCSEEVSVASAEGAKHDYRLRRKINYRKFRPEAGVSRCREKKSIY